MVCSSHNFSPVWKLNHPITNLTTTFKPRDMDWGCEGWSGQGPCEVTYVKNVPCLDGRTDSSPDKCPVVGGNFTKKSDNSTGSWKAAGLWWWDRMSGHVWTLLLSCKDHGWQSHQFMAVFMVVRLCLLLIAPLLLLPLQSRHKMPSRCISPSCYHAATLFANLQTILKQFTNSTSNIFLSLVTLQNRSRSLSWAQVIC